MYAVSGLVCVPFLGFLRDAKLIGTRTLMEDLAINIYFSRRDAMHRVSVAPVHRTIVPNIKTYCSVLDVLCCMRRDASRLYG